MSLPSLSERLAQLRTRRERLAAALTRTQYQEADLLQRYADEQRQYAEEHSFEYRGQPVVVREAFAHYVGAELVISYRLYTPTGRLVDCLQEAAIGRAGE